MDSFDKQILDIIQSDFPIAERPYAEVGKALGLSEEDVMARIRALRESGVIRRIGGNFQSRELGWHSTLCAAAVPEDQIDAFVAEVNAHPGVTHNYLRKNHFNIWFTFIGESKEMVAETLAAITEKTGIRILNLPAEEMYKIKVDFKMDSSAE